MKQQFAQARANVLAHAKLENTPVAQRNSSKSGNATAEVDVIDLISQSVASLEKSQPTILPCSQSQ